MTVEEIHKRLRQLMKEKGFSSYRLAENSGLTQSSVYNMFERGTMPKIETLDMMCRGLDISLSDFFIYASRPGPGGYLSESDEKLLEVNRSLSEGSRDRLLFLAIGMLEAERLRDDDGKDDPDCGGNSRSGFWRQ